MINYSDKFKKYVRAVYGAQFDTMLNEGSEWLGRYLDDSSSDNIGITDVLQATDLKALQDKALLIKAKRDLYNDYWKEKEKPQTV